MNITTPSEAEVPVLVSSKKQRSARSSGKKGWTPAVPEIRRLVGCSYSANDGFSPHMLVWAKLDGGPWWPARVVGVDEIPEDLKKQEEGWTCVKYYAVNSTKSFSWVKAEDLSTFEKNAKEFSQQSIPNDFNGGSFKAALIEIQESADRRNANTTPKPSSGTTKHQESKVLPASSSQNEEDVMKDGTHVGDVIDQPLKRRKLKFKGVEKVPSVPGTDDHLDTPSRGKELSKELKGQDRSIEMKNKRKRFVKQQTESDGEGTATGESVELPNKKLGSTTPNATGLSSRDLVKKARGKKTGADGYYFECMVCDIGGNLLCCDLCPRVYHLECLVPPLKRTPPGKWICPVCRDSIGPLKALGLQTSDSKPKVKTTNESELTADVSVPKARPGPKRGWKLFHRGKQLTSDVDLRKLRKRKREEDMDRPRKKLNLKPNRPLSSQAQPKCRQCGAGIHSSGESSSNVFCSDCVELVKKRNLHSTGRMGLPRKDMIPTRHSKLKPGKCDICSKPGLVIFCDHCPRGFHKDCLNPPRKRAPKGAWSCPRCGPVKEVKEVKDAKVLREGREAAIETKEGKTAKSAKVVRDNEQRLDGKDEQTSAIPSTLEVDRILGCRISLSSSSTHNLVESVGDGIPTSCKALGSLEDGLKSEPGQCTPGLRSEEGKIIEVRLPICEGEQVSKDGSVGPTEPSCAPGMSATIGAIPESVGYVGKKSTIPLIGSAQADLSSTITSGDLELRVANAVPSQLQKTAGETETQSETRAVEEFNSDGKDQESINGGLQTSMSDAGASKEESGGVAAISQMSKSCVENIDTSHGDAPCVPISASQGQELASSGTDGDDFENRSSLGLTSSSKVVCFPDELQPAVDNNGKVIKDSVLVTEDVAVVSDKGVAHKASGRAVPQPELEFLVKWAGRAHIHNEWVSEELLRGIAKRKLENFKSKHGNAPNVIVEDQWVKPQRIVAKRTVQDNGEEVLVKWSGLSYDECTWERVDHPVILGDVQLIESFERFEQEARSDTELVDKNANSLDPSFLRGQRPLEIEAIQEQPEYLKGGSLFPHQTEALNWLRKCWQRQRNVILADEMGLGKTISACSFIASLRHEFKVRAPCLVLVPLSTMPNWLAEFALWAPSLNIIEYHGSSKARALIREYEWHADAVDGTSKKSKHTYKFNVMLTTYEMVIQDASQLRAVPWEVLVVDEGHRLKNSSSKLFTLLNTFSFSHRVLLTGTPLQNNFGEMFNLLNFLQPDAFPSLAAFQDKFSSLSTAEQVEELKKLVQPNMLRRLKRDAMQKIPPKMELVVPVDMNSVQVEYYKALLTRNYQVLRNGGKHQSMLNIVMQLRKVCNHPYLIAGTEPDAGTPEFLQEMRINASAKLMLLHSMLGKLKADGHRVLIFSQMTKLLDILEDYLSFEFGHDAFERVDGSVSVAERQTAIARFNQDTSRFVFLLSTRACGLGINLATADTVIIYDSDFNPQADIQAMNRAHRIGQSKTLLVYRLVVRASVEERILHLAKKKLMLDHLFANKSGSQKEVDDILKWGTEELFQETSSLPDELGSGSGIAVTGDNGDGKQRKKGGELGDMYGGYYLQSGRSKVVWDDAAVRRLLDRSDLGTCQPEDAQGEQESDILGSLKAWDWNDQDSVPEEHDGEGTLDKECVVENAHKNPAPDEDNQWDKLLRSRWETMQIDEEAALGRGKRNRKTVSYIESNGQKSKELLSESSDVEKDDDPEPDYTPVGRALKQKLARLRARQKVRIMQRYSNEASRSVDGGMLAQAPGVSWDGMGILRNFDSTKDGHPAQRLSSTSLLSGGGSGDGYSQADGKVNVTSPTSSQGLLNASVGVEEEALQRNSCSPSLPVTDREWQRNIMSAQITQLPITAGLSKPKDEGGDNCKGSSNSHGPGAWLGGRTSNIESAPILSHLFGKPVARADDNLLDAPAISLSSVSQGLESGRSLSQLIPALRNSLQGVQYGNHSLSYAPVQLDLRDPIAAVEGASNNNSSQEDSGFNVLSRSASVAKSVLNSEEIKDMLGHQYKSQPPDVAVEFSQRIFGWEKNLNTSDTLSAGEEVSGQQSIQGKMLPLNLTTVLLPDDNSRLQLQKGSAPGTDVSLQSSRQGAKAPNLSIALGLQLMETSPTSDGREARTSTPAPLFRSLSSGVSTKTADVQAVGLSHPRSLLHKLGTKEMMPIELDDDEPEVIVSTRRFLSPGIAEGTTGRGWPPEDLRKRREQGNQAWSEDELDALWTGVRRHGLGNWRTMLLDVRLRFLKSRSVGELAERWKEEQRKMFGNSEQASEAGNKLPWTSAPALSGKESDSERGLSHRVGRDRGLVRPSGTERGPSQTSGTDRGRPSHTRVNLTSATNSEPGLVHPDDKFFSRHQEKKESLPGIPDFEINLSKERHPYRSTSKAGNVSSLSGLQFVNKSGDLGRPEISKQGLHYQNLLDLQSGRSSPSIPSSIPGRTTPAAGAVQGANLGSFALSSEGIGRLNDNFFRNIGVAPDQIGGESGPSLSPGLGLGSDWRRQESREKPIWSQQRPSFSVTDGGKYQSGLGDRSGVLRSQDSHLNVQVPPAPSVRMGSPPGHSLGNKALVSLPHNGGPISTAEHRRRARGVSSAKAMSSAHADDSAASSLPHWLREAVKARSAPPQPPLPPAIAAVVQATNIVYKHTKPLLPRLTHPGYPLVPPREFPKKVKKRHRQTSNHQQRSIRTESLTIGNASATGDLSRPIKLEGLNPALVPLPNFESGGATNSRSLSALGQVSSSISWPKGFPDLPLLSGLDHTKQQQASHIPADSLSELMATRRSIIELGLMAGLHPSIVSALNMDEINTQSSLVGKGRRPWPELGSDSGRLWTSSQTLPSSSALAPSSTLVPTIPLSSERHSSRSSQGAMLSQALPVGRMGEGSFSELEKKSQLPQWLTSGEPAKLGGSAGQEHQPDVDVADDDNESTSSKTVSDPGVRSKCGKDDGNSDDASSEETISDDGTQ